MSSQPSDFEQILAAWHEQNAIARLWAGDVSLWPNATGADSATQRLGWLTLPQSFARRVAELEQRLPKAIGNIFLIGMGGSSLAPETFAALAANKRLRIVDSTHPDNVRAHLAALSGEYIVVVASKSGTTLETNDLFSAFWHVAKSRLANAMQSFVVISDADTPLVHEAASLGIKYIVSAPSDVGGRFSALTEFGLTPALLCGIDAKLWRASLQSAATACQKQVADNPAARLAAYLLSHYRQGRDKMLLELNPARSALFAWIEQLVAESLGKKGQGIVPLDAARQCAAAKARPDLFRLAIADEAMAQHAASLTMRDIDDTAGLMFVWEFAVALLGVALGVNPFDQPDVEAAKRRARLLLTQQTSLDPRLHAAETDIAGVFDWLSRAQGYVAIQAFVNPDTANVPLNRLAAKVAATSGLPVTVGIGPRFLHSSGQLHKASTAKGTYLQVVDAIRQDLDVPGKPYGFGQLLRAQADGDLLTLLDLGANVKRIAVRDWAELSL